MRYSVEIEYTRSYRVWVSADSENEAIDKAEKEFAPSDEHPIRSIDINAWLVEPEGV